MQLSLSSASPDTLPMPARAASDVASARSDSAAPKTPAQSEDRPPSDFDHFLSPAEEKARPVSAPVVSSRKPRATEAPLGSPLDPAASPDLAAMLAFLATPAAPTPPPLTLPEIPETLLSAPLASDVVAPGSFSADEKPAVPFVPRAAIDLPSSASALLTPGTPLAPPPPVTAAAPAVALPLSAPPAAAPAQPTLTVPTEVAALATATIAPRPAEPTTTNLRRAAPTSPASTAPAATVLAGSAANLADSASLSTANEKAAPKGISRNFLTSDEEEVKNTVERLGTDVAKPPVTMAADPFSHRQSSAAEAGVIAANVSPSPGATPDFASRINDTASIAHRAVDAVMTAAERVTGERNAVDLQFSFGGSELAVRVEYRGGAVHATFKTDSPELRAALAHEWSAAGSKMTDASVRMAPPVFTSSNTGSSTSFSGEGAQQHARDSAARASAEMFSLSPGRAARAGSSTEDRAPAASPRAALSTAVHLHTFA